MAVVQYRNLSSAACFAYCHRAYVESVACIPLKWVLGFSISENFANQNNLASRVLSGLCCLPDVASNLRIKIMTNAGFGKVYLDPMTITQRSLPRTTEPRCYFEEEKVVELRRWLGNLALFYYENEAGEKTGLDLWKCEAPEGARSRGWVPA
jgi:hypothetical protein